MMLVIKMVAHLTMRTNDAGMTRAREGTGTLRRTGPYPPEITKLLGKLQKYFFGARSLKGPKSVGPSKPQKKSAIPTIDVVVVFVSLIL